MPDFSLFPNDLALLYTLTISTALPFLRFMICGWLFTYNLKRKPNTPSYFVLSLVLMLLSGIAVILFRFYVNLHVVHIISRVINYLCVLPFIFLCFDESKTTKLLCWSGCIATQELGEQLALLIMALFGASDAFSMAGFRDSVMLRDYPLYFLFRFLVYWGSYRVFGKTDQVEYDRSMTQKITWFSVFTTLALSLLSSIVREYRYESGALYYAGTFFVLLYSLTILIIRTGMLSYGRELHEKSLMEQMMAGNQKRYLETKEAIDIINMRCHDLKRHLARVQEKLDSEELEILRQAIAIYDRNIQTGNDILDVFLNAKQLACQEKQIAFSCMANGKILSFMSIAHLSSLFGNAIDNAVEAVSQLPEPERRVIDITVHQAGPNAVIHLSNYFSGQAIPSETSKPDRNRHGFGMKSIKYVADQYGGTVSINMEQDIFTLEITIPLPKTEVTGFGD